MRKSVGFTGFTIVEILVILTVLGILIGVTTVGYGTWQRSLSAKNIQSDLTQAASFMKSYRNFQNFYPTSLAAESGSAPSFTPSPGVSVTLTTNATAHYSGLTDAQNAQLFVDTCNSVMPLTSGSYTYATTCIGQWGMNINGGSHGGYVNTPITTSFTLVGPACANPASNPSYCMPYHTVATNATNELRTKFTDQGGTFPVQMTNNTPATLPPPDSGTGKATTYCAEARPTKYTDIVKHITQDGTIQDGPC